MSKRITVEAHFGKAKIFRTAEGWVVRRMGTINGHSAMQSTPCKNLFAAIKEKYINR